MPGGDLSRRAPAKINLALHVLGRGDDGYHELDTIAVFADVADHVTVAAADHLTLAVEGPLARHAPAGPENLVLRAARLLQDRAGLGGGAAIRLEKNLPAGAGFGGGSADAAAILQALNALWNLDLSTDELAALGRDLGADVPMCLAASPLRARGTGERIETLENWPALPLLLLWPGQPVSTAEVFGALQRRDNEPLPEAPHVETPAEAAEWLRSCRNDLEPAALRAAPVIAEALAELRGAPGCLLARMSGSGAGCFGLYDTLEAAQAAAAALSGRRPGWWIVATTAGGVVPA